MLLNVIAGTESNDCLWVRTRGTHRAKIPAEKGAEVRKSCLYGMTNGLAFSGIKPSVGRGEPRVPLPELVCLQARFSYIPACNAQAGKDI